MRIIIEFDETESEVLIDEFLNEMCKE